MISNNGKEFDAHIQINAERRGIEYIFDNDKLFNRQSLGGVELTKQQVEDLNAGKAIFVEGMERKDGERFSSYVKLDEVTGPPIPATIPTPRRAHGKFISRTRSMA